MLAFHESTWQIWTPGTRLPSGLTPPPNAEAAFSPEELTAVGLAPVTREAVPAGQRATAWNLVDVEGAPVYRPTLEDVPPEVPGRITNFQMRAILLRRGHFETVNVIVQDSESPELIAAFEYANEVYRTGAAVAGIKAAMQWSDAYLDELFIEAAEIEA